MIIIICCLLYRQKQKHPFLLKKIIEQANFQWDGDEVHFVLDQHA